MVPKNIIIIGAGAAGIAAASKLAANNICNLTILEAEDHIGGRILTSEFGEGNVELGAQWVHGEVNNIAHSLGSSAGLLDDNSYGIAKSRYVFSDGSFMRDETAWKLYYMCEEVLHEEHKLSSFKGSLGEYFIESIKKKLKDEAKDIENKTVQSFLEWFHRFENSIDGSDSWFQTSASGHLEYHECPGNSLTRWKTGGYSNIFNLLMATHRTKILEKILYNKTVETISWNQQPLEVLCTDGHKFMADHVLLTVSLGVLKENVERLFNPPLPPSKIRAIQGLGIGTVDKIFLKFPYRWWPIDSVGFSLLWRKTDVSPEIEEQCGWLSEVFGFYSVDDNPQVMCGWVVGPAARHMEQCSDQQVKDSCHQLLVKFLGKHFNIPEPESVLRSQWHVNPHFRGSYSFRSMTSEVPGVSADVLASPILRSKKPVLLFAGEATHDHFYSTVHGAIETGWREADRLITHLSTSTLSKLPKASL